MHMTIFVAMNLHSFAVIFVFDQHLAAYVFWYVAQVLHTRREHHAHGYSGDGNDPFEACQAGSRHAAADLAQIGEDIVGGFRDPLVLGAAGIGLRQRAQERHVGDTDAMRAENRADDVFCFNGGGARKQPRQPFAFLGLRAFANDTGNASQLAEYEKDRGCTSSLRAREGFGDGSEVAGRRQEPFHALLRHGVRVRHGAYRHSLGHADFERRKRGSQFSAQQIGDGPCLVGVEP